MSKPIAPPPAVIPHVIPLANQQVVNSPNSTAQTDAQLTTTSAIGPDPSEPTLSNKEVPKYPLGTAADSITLDSLVLEHSAPESRDHSVSSSQTSATTASPATVYSILSMSDLTEAALLGDANAQFELGKRFDQGDGVPVNYEEALKWYTQSAEQGHLKAQHNLAGMYYYGKGVEKDEAKAVEYYKMAAKQGSALSQYNLSLLYQQGEGLMKNDAIAFSWCLEAAKQGYSDAQYELGMLYQLGQGVNPDPTLEYTWFSKAADQGHSEAQCELAFFYLSGSEEVGIDKDVPKAIDLFEKAANQGLAKAQSQLGYVYMNDIYNREDYDKAIYWLRLAADQDDLTGQELLGVMYQKGHGVKQSDENAFIWIEKAAKQGSKSAQHELSLVYKEGKGIKKDFNRSVYWQMKCNLNDDDGGDGDCIRGTFLDISLSAGLNEFIAKNLIEKKEFKKVTKLDYTQHSFSDDEILGVCALIRKNLEIKSLVLKSLNDLSDTYLNLIIDALDDNIYLTKFLFDDYFVDGKIKDKIAALLARNVAIAELREYVQDYPLINTASFPLDILIIIIDKVIVSYMISGKSKEETKNAIDALLLDANVFELEAEVKN